MGGTGKSSRSWASAEVGFLGKHPQDRLWDSMWEWSRVCVVLQSLINGFSLDGTRHQR